MKPIVGHLELNQNNFTKWLFLGLSALSLVAFLFDQKPE
jgi:hypothetical protein